MSKLKFYELAALASVIQNRQAMETKAKPDKKIKDRSVVKAKRKQNRKKKK